MKKVIGYESLDGTIHRTEDEAMLHDQKVFEEGEFNSACKKHDAELKGRAGLNYSTSYHGWKCEQSPTEKCVYNPDHDPMLDFCVYCGHPDERK